MAVFAGTIVLELIRALVTPGHVPMARASPWFTGIMALAWAVLVLVLLRMRATARANRGLDLSIALRQAGRPVAAATLATRLGVALGGGAATVGETIREDYGAGAWVEAGTERFWLSVSSEGGRDVVVGLAYDPGPDLARRLSHRADRAAFARLAAALQAAIDVDPALQRA
ncbi:hypothetical protein AAFN86_19940 [Roseomonas sp. CAU 1739]